jgi:hypothetical protein
MMGAETVKHYMKNGKDVFAVEHEGRVRYRFDTAREAQHEAAEHNRNHERDPSPEAESEKFTERREQARALRAAQAARDAAGRTRSKEKNGGV